MRTWTHARGMPPWAEATPPAQLTDDHAANDELPVSCSSRTAGLARDIPAMAVGDWIGAEHSNQTHPSREWLSVAASRVMLSRELREHTSS
jgi:hypothetical protein